MNQISISIKNELKYFLELFYTLSKIYFYFDYIYIRCDLKYIEINTLLYYNLHNVIFIKNNDDFNNNIDDNCNTILFIDNKSFMKKLKITSTMFSDNSINNMIYRDVYQENIFYIKLSENISNKYIFYFNYDTKNIINYFGDLYIYNPIYNFYDEDDRLFDKWVDLCPNNISYYLTIIQESTELHIYDIDMLYLISNIDVSHISKKYFYCDNVLIKEENDNFKDWTIILIK